MSRKEFYLEFILIASAVLLLLSVSLTSYSQKIDLQVVEISQPDLWENQDGDYGSQFIVTIHNKGKKDLENVEVKAWDLDISLQEGIDKWGISKDDYWILEENEGRAEEDGALDYDADWSETKQLLKIKKGAKIKLTFYVNHWIYDSNCEIGVEIDPNNKIKESDEDNNRLGFFAGG